MTKLQHSEGTQQPSAPLFLRLFALLQLRQETEPNQERQLLIERLRPLRNMVVSTAERDELMLAETNSAVSELLEYLGMLERSSLGTPQAQTNRLLSTPNDIDRALQQSPVESPAATAPSSTASSALNKYVESLVDPAVNGEPDAVGRLLTVIRPLVVRYCRARIRAIEQSYQVADETAQEACLAVLVALPTYQSQGRPFLAFVYGITAHKVADIHRAIRRDQPRPAPQSNAKHVDPAPRSGVNFTQNAAIINNILNMLSPRQRDILVLRLVAGLSADEVAAAVGSTPGAIRVAQHRALARLRKTVTRQSVTSGEDPVRTGGEEGT